MKTILAAAAAFFVLTGCAYLTEGNADAKLITQYAVLKIADGDSAKADRIAEVATEIREYLSGDKLATVDLLVEAIRDRVPWQDLDAPDELLINALLDRLNLELVERLGEDVLPEDLRLAADTVAAWVIQAAEMV